MKRNIAVIAGGDSGEYEVSIKSGRQIFNAADRNLFNPTMIHMKGLEWTAQVDGKEVTVDKNDFSVNVAGQKITFDCAVIVIHGTPGENGLLQSYFELLKIPYTTCGVLASALTFNKFATKHYLIPYGVLTAKSLLFHKNDTINPDEVVAQLGLPCFVKPNNGGSSCGTSKISEKNDILPAIRTALEHDAEVIVEEFIKGTEITCGVMKTRKKSVVFPIAEIVSKKDFFDYEAKYSDGMAEEIIPARISTELKEECEKLSSLIYDKLFCRGVVRIDYIIRNNKLYFLEVNTVPGQSEASIIPRMIKATGATVSQFITDLVEDALAG